ncbi:hypothetical protein DXD84_14065 [Dorea formicigenerans]|jgi:uncharacterized C2H2 Zn-finger protein|uniref:Carbohydrate-binding domain-containing protein n=2 Tax=Dorea formicigenerans TaxID=39486 RepID=A0A3E4EWY0_9FIRM|nr:carbohydrate-binding domain-containing protein [Dorea formicigenerans]RGI80878.1 hypothetical protein DXD84_14065 [Dorea formicigenerans]RGI84497.1 hypothetical protein DXD82_14580 [Dorea formicigenerans]
MKKMKKKAWACLMALAMVLTMLPGMAVKAEAATSYGLWVGDTEVTSACTRGEGWRYEAVTNTLTLNGFTYTGVGTKASTEGNSGGIRATMKQTLNIVLVNDNNIENTSDNQKNWNCGILCEYDLVISGDGSLTVKGGTGHTSHGISGGSLTIYGGTITAVGKAAKGSSGIFMRNDVTVNGGNVTATADTSSSSTSRGIECNKTFTINGGKVTAIAKEASTNSYGIQAASIKHKEGELEAEGATRAFSSNQYPDGYEKGKVYPKKDLTTEMFIFTAPSDLKYDGNPKNAVVNSKDDISYGKITIQYYKNGAKIEGVPINTGTYTVKIDVAGNKDYNAISDLTDESWTFTITHEHKYQYMHDDTEHWQQCTVPGCVYSINREKHSGGTASCTKKAICTTCKIEYGEIDSQNHVNVEHHELKPATCAVPGVAEYWSCSECHKMFSDAACTAELNTTEVPALKHAHKTFTEAKKATCTEKGNRAYWHCEDCGLYFADKDGVIDTEKSYDNAVGFDIAPLNHSNVKKQEATTATCNDKGNDAYWHCEDCGLYFADKDGVIDTEKSYDDNSSFIRNSLGHDFTKQIEDEAHMKVAATCTLEGEYYYSCLRCDAISADATFKVEKLGHSFTNYVYNNDATYEKDGTETAKCNRCDATDTRRKEGTKLVAAPVTYKIIEGADGTYTANTDGTYTIRANGEFSKFVSVEMDGKVVDSKNYTAKSGSTIITFSKEYMSSLSAGKHTVKVNFTDGSAETTLTVAQKDTKDTGKTDVGKKSASKSAKTGDNSNLIAWFILLAASVCIVGSLRVIRRQRRR